MSRIIRIYEKTSRALSAPLAERGLTPPPVYLFHELIRRCTHRCNMCNIWKEATDGMPLDEIKRVFSHPLFNRIERVILTGGEPTLRKDIKEIGAFYAKRFPKLNLVAVLTTGFGSKRILEGTKALLAELKAHPNQPRLLIQVSFDGIGEIYNRIRNIPKAWDETHETVMQLLALRKTEPLLDVMLHCVIQPINVRSLDEIEAFSSAHGVAALYSLAVISDTYFGNADLEDRLDFTQEEKQLAQDFFARCRKVAEAPEMPLYYNDLAQMLDGGLRSRHCMMGYYMIYVRMDGKVFPCVNSGDLVMGDLTTQDPDEVWYGKGSNAARKKVRKEFCPTCASACYSDITGIKELFAAAVHKFKSRKVAS